MSTLIEPGAELQRLYTGTAWGEGPAWIPSTAKLRWSDIPGDRIMEYDSATDTTRVYRDGVEFTNGRTLDLHGRVVQCSHGKRSIERETGGVPEMLADRWEGKRFNSPNDIVVASDGTIWFTDPPYGIHPSGREGHPGEPEYGGCYVFRLNEVAGSLTAVITDMIHPNGLAFSPDESVLYVSDTSYLQEPGGFAHIRAYDVVAGACVNARIFAEVRPGAADGFRVDAEGRIWASSADSVQVYAPSGERLQVIPVPEKVSNLCFGGEDGHDLYITASTSLYRIRTTTIQAPRA